MICKPCANGQHPKETDCHCPCQHRENAPVIDSLTGKPFKNPNADSGER